MKQIERIKRIAMKVREAMEKFAPTVNSKICGNVESLACYCAISSHALITALRKKGIKARLIVGFYDENGEWLNYDGKDDYFRPNHCWVEVPFHYVDITATQYDTTREKVFIVDNINTLENGYHALAYRINKKSWGIQSPDRKYTRQILTLAQI